MSDTQNKHIVYERVSGDQHEQYDGCAHYLLDRGFVTGTVESLAREMWLAANHELKPLQPPLEQIDPQGKNANIPDVFCINDYSK